MDKKNIRFNLNFGSEINLILDNLLLIFVSNCYLNNRAVKQFCIVRPLASQLAYKTKDFSRFRILIVYFFIAFPSDCLVRNLSFAACLYLCFYVV